MIKFLNYFFQSLIIYFFFIVGKLIGLRLSRKLFGMIFQRIAPTFKSKEIIKNNLRTFSTKIEDHEAKVIISSMWKNYGMTFIEYIFLKFFRNNNKHIQIEGQSNIDEIIKKNEPVIFVSGHFANYELMSMEITKRDIKLATIYRPLNNYFLNPFMEYLRRKFVCQNQIKKGIKGVREAINYIKRDYSIALMIDQRVSEGEKINFFGKPALTTTLPAQLALKYKLSIYPVFIERLGDSNFKIKFFNEIKSTEFSNKIQLTEKLNRELEKMITNNPNQWIWTHNRWK